MPLVPTVDAGDREGQRQGGGGRSQIAVQDGGLIRFRESICIYVINEHPCFPTGR